VRRGARLLIATTSRDKLREIRGLLADLPVELVGLPDLSPVPEPEETGLTFQDNARLKALYYDHCLADASRGRDEAPFTVAEDSGLVVEALDGDPGVRSARFLRPDASYPERFAEIHRRLAQCPERMRRAQFVCALAVARAGAVVFETVGEVEGEVSRVPRGNHGFGYDPIFYYPPYGCTLGEVTEEEKLRVAHRGQAFRQLAEWLKRGM
jgi:XTP/dITP diphosphohydrolase